MGSSATYRLGNDGGWGGIGVALFVIFMSIMCCAGPYLMDSPEGTSAPEKKQEATLVPLSGNEGGGFEAVTIYNSTGYAYSKGGTNQGHLKKNTHVSVIEIVGNYAHIRVSGLAQDNVWLDDKNALQKTTP